MAPDSGRIGAGDGDERTAYVNARLIDPASGLDSPGALLSINGKIADLGPRLFADGVPVLANVLNDHVHHDARVCHVAKQLGGDPGSVDHPGNGDLCFVFVIRNPRDHDPFHVLILLDHQRPWTLGEA